ncbi:hypothetical protein BDF19DRAFT_441107 [Syncephalis fuscata]|nr:hypothetical protein BDF19DRAFT_441107 [Syncephalis fuscata]
MSTTNDSQEKRQTKRQRKAESFRKGGSKKSRNEDGKPTPSQHDSDDEVVAPDLKRLVADSGSIFKLSGDNPSSNKEASRQKKNSKASSKTDNSTASKATVIQKPTTIAPPAIPKPKKEATTATTNATDKKRRFIVFVGRLPRTIKKEEIEQHFASAGNITDIRLLTEKGTNAPRGCGFVEFASAESLGIALGLHQSKLGGKKISVELTVGGGGKSENRTNRLRDKNEKLRTQQVRCGYG